MTRISTFLSPVRPSASVTRIVPFQFAIVLVVTVFAENKASVPSALVAAIVGLPTKAFPLLETIFHDSFLRPLFALKVNL